MKASRSAGTVGWIAGVLATVLFAAAVSRRLPNSTPTLNQTISLPVNQLEDLAGTAFGLRRLAADVAWIQTLEYYGTREEDLSESEADNGMGHYPLFLSYCLRTARLDPHFTYIYYYGAGALGWNLNRLDEAETLLQEGIRGNPQEWRLQQYLAALSFQKNHDPVKIIQFLESYVYDPQCPNILRNILAHVYRKNGRYVDALRLLLLMKETGDPVYAPTAEREIPELVGLIRADDMGHKAH